MYALAGLLKLPEVYAQDKTLAVEAVKRWLGSHERWLLILDNADDLAMTREFIPPGKNGHVLLTTRAQEVSAIARRVEIGATARNGKYSVNGILSVSCLLLSKNRLADKPMSIRHDRNRSREWPLLHWEDYSPLRAEITAGQSPGR